MNIQGDLTVTAAVGTAREYPKIDTLFDRDERTFKVIPGKFRRPEFDLVGEWDVYEKIDGTNVRVIYRPDMDILLFGGRTDNAQMPPRLMAVLTSMFPKSKMKEVFGADGATDEVVLYGEGYGPTIQKGGGNYRGDVSFRLFDVLVGK